jgi:uncharacterized membrane protein YoaK (UPF0700 family)
MKLSVPVLLSFNAGFVDTAGFLSLHGLFTAHVTGNFVTLGATIALGASGAAAKLLALPIFCLVIVATRLISFSLPAIGLPILRTMLGVKTLLLIIGAIMMIWLGRGGDPDGWFAIAAGMVLVAAMAIQNAAHRIHMASAPPTTLMTGSTTQIMIDLADLLRGVPPEQRAAVHERLAKLSVSVLTFAVGCGAAALLLIGLGNWCFVVPPLVAMVTLVIRV